jgi:hypothetical protein
VPLPADIERIQDPLIRAGVSAAIEKTLLPAATEKAYPGHFNVVADGSHYGGDSTWPGLDSWEMAGAYLLLGREQLVRDYFDFVRASQRSDGNIPIAIVPADPPPDTSSYGRGLRYPQDVYSYGGRRWIGLFHHWQTEVNPLSVLGPISYILTAAELRVSEQANLRSVRLAADYILGRVSENGLVSGAGFYIESPPRNQWDGVTQCFAVFALHRAADLLDNAHIRAEAGRLDKRFREVFWRGDHFAEYVHPQRGVVDSHGLSDVNWAAVALGVALPDQAKALWPRMTAEKSLWHGGMPTQLVARPDSYEPWEFHEPLPFVPTNGPTYDAAAMGRVWFLEALACARMGEWDRLRESVRLVCALGERHGWQWYERYHAQPDGTVKPAGPRGYCEYAAILVRVVLGNLDAFT